MTYDVGHDMIKWTEGESLAFKIIHIDMYLWQIECCQCPEQTVKKWNVAFKRFDGKQCLSRAHVPTLNREISLRHRRRNHARRIIFTNYQLNIFILGDQTVVVRRRNVCRITKCKKRQNVEVVLPRWICKSM